MEWAPLPPSADLLSPCPGAPARENPHLSVPPPRASVPPALQLLSICGLASCVQKPKPAPRVLPASMLSPSRAHGGTGPSKPRLLALHVPGQNRLPAPGPNSRLTFPPLVERRQYCVLPSGHTLCTQQALALGISKEAFGVHRTHCLLQDEALVAEVWLLTPAGSS